VVATGKPSAEGIRLVASGLVFLALIALNVVAGGAGLAPAAAGRGGNGSAAGAAGAGAGPGDSLVRRGHALFLAKGCAGCHTLRGVSEGAPIGPDLTPLGQTARGRRPGLGPEDYVRESIVAPDAFLVPGFPAAGDTRMPRIELSGADVEALVAFLLAAGGSR
jgi:mono/diheme cytochrome c family protein